MWYLWPPIGPLPTHPLSNTLSPTSCTPATHSRHYLAPAQSPHQASLSSCQSIWLFAVGKVTLPSPSTHTLRRRHMSRMIAERHWGKQSRSLNDGIIFQIDVKFQNNFIRSLSRIQGSGTCVFLELVFSWNLLPALAQYLDQLHLNRDIVTF